MSDLPLLKWAGDKRWFASRLGAISGTPLTARLVESFAGSWAFFFALAPTTVLLADGNRELIAAARGVQKDPDGILNALSQLQIDKDCFQQMQIALERSTCMAADSLQGGSCVGWLILSRSRIRNRATLLKRLGG
jgi:site-specific DNA-adenine methylase